ncbi:MAG: pilus assembly protein PilM [Clostridia bacterium]|nr:pilus assembly protein PilM [Clostridia bacterium]
MGKLCTGIDIGANEVKFAVCKDGALLRREKAVLPDNVVRDGVVVSPAALGQFLKETAKERKLRRGACALVLPAAAAFFRRSVMPAMTAEHLKLNLPYEFRDYITEERSKYIFDYAVLGMEHDEQGEPASMDIMAAAALRETIESYRNILKYAGFTMQTAVPEEVAYSNLLRRYEAQNPTGEKREYCILDMGHSATRLYFYTGCAHEATQLIDYGCATLDEAIAETYNVDIHMAASYKTANYEGALEAENCKNFYAKLAIDLMQALNFYNYNNPENALRDIYFCGGGAQIQPLKDAICERVTLATHDIETLMPPSEGSQEPASLYPAAYGVTLQ